ncbi:MAG TPA: YibE/F family protein [Kribbellaceae bacterium]|nr:YibE/F family protein [Kribbellaceae bacterium]
MARQSGRRRASHARGRARDRIEVPEGHGHGHGHGHGGEVDTSSVDSDAVVARRVRMVVAGLLAPMIVAAIVLTVVLWPRHDVTSSELFTDQARGVVGAIEPCTGEKAKSCDLAKVRITSATAGGKDKVVPVEIPKGQFAPKVAEGDRVMIGIISKPGQPPQYTYIDHDRSRPLLLLGALFALAVVALSRWRGVAALGALVVTGLVLTKFVLPAILDGSNALLVAVVGGTLIMVLALYLTHGFNAHTSVAMVGTIGALALTAALGDGFIVLSKITGIGIESASTVSAYAPNLDLQGLLVAGLVIGALGVLDDVTVTQVTAVWELSAANPNASRRALFGAGLRIGRAHVASVVNTLVLAYAGAALPTLLLFALSKAPGSYTVSTEDVAIQVVSGLVGSLGLIAAVPLTTALAALAVGDRTTSRRGVSVVPAPDRPPADYPSAGYYP